MNKSIKYIIFILTTVLVLIIGLWTYIYPPLPIYEGNITLDGLSDTVSVYTDTFGVPHVFAKNDTDLFFSAGYIAARERLFQMSMVAYAVRGELASALGDKYVSSDIYLRTWKIPKTAKKQTTKNHKNDPRKISIIVPETIIKVVKTEPQKLSH